MIIYNVPGRTASNVLPETVLALAEIENIAGVKEASGDVDQVMTLIRERPEGFTVLSGDDALTFPLNLAGAGGELDLAAVTEVRAGRARRRVEGDEPGVVGRGEDAPPFVRARS